MHLLMLDEAMVDAVFYSETPDQATKKNIYLENLSLCQFIKDSSYEDYVSKNLTKKKCLKIKEGFYQDENTVH